MFTLRLLGGLSLQGPDGLVTGPGAQRRRLALLALLAVPAGRPVSRDKLIACLWPEEEGSRARRHLSHALYVLRRIIGPEAVQAVADDLSLNPEIVGTDVAAFEDALSRGSHEEAVRLYAGPFLDGVYLDAAGEFERWADAHRGRLARLHQAALETLAVAAEGSGSPGEAVSWWRRSAAADPYSSRVATRLMAALEAVGDRPAALRHARDHEERVRRELGADPDPELLALAEDLRTRSTRPPEGPLRVDGRGSPPHRSAPVEPAPVEERPTSPGAPGEPGAPEPLLGAEEVAPASSPAAVRSRRRAGTVLLGLFAALLTASALAIVASSRSAARAGSPSPPSAGGLVAVFPFRVSGVDPELRHLREGMVDLLGSRLTGVGGPRAVDPRTTLRAWRRAGGSEREDLPPASAVRVAAGLGASRLLLGEVVGGPERLTVQATVLSAGGGRERFSVAVEGDPDSLTALVDRLAGRLLLRVAGESEEALEHWVAGSLPALRLYLEGHAAYRRDNYVGAIEAFNTALDIDSTFAPAAIGLAEAGFWTAGGFEAVNRDVRRGLRLAWSAVDRLGPRDSAYLAVLTRPRFPEWTGPWAEDLRAWQAALVPLESKPEVWFELGRRLFHFGPQAEVEGAHTKAVGAFHRAVALDSAFAAPLGYLVVLAARAGDRKEVRRLADLYFTRAGGGELEGYMRWRVAHAMGDRAALDSLRARFHLLHSESLERILGYAQLDNVGLEDAELAARALSDRSLGPEPVNYDHRMGALYSLKNWALNTGRPGWAASLLRERIWRGITDGRRYASDHLLAALYEDGDTAGLGEAYRRLSRGLVRDPYPDRGAEERARLRDRCWAEQWRLWHGDTATAAAALDTLRRAPPVRRFLELPYYVASEEGCAVVLEALLAAARGGGPDAEEVRARIEAHSRAGWTYPYGFMINLAAARLHELAADPAAALAAVRRRPYLFRYGNWTFATLLREEGRLAALAGDREGAVRAYRHFLALHSDPEPARIPVVERVRAELGRLVAGEEPTLLSPVETGGPPRDLGAWEWSRPESNR